MPIPANTINPKGFQLRIIAGVDEGKVFALERCRQVIVGGSAAADFAIKEILAPGQRFAIVWSAEKEAYLLEVWPHPTPVFLNGQRCSDGQMPALAEGDAIALGDTILVFERANA